MRDTAPERHFLVLGGTLALLRGWWWYQLALKLGEQVQFAAQQFQSPVGGARIWLIGIQLHYVG